MERDPRGFLWDVRESADAIQRFIAGRSLDDYLADEMLTAAVERHFEIIGEALNRLAKTAPDIAVRVPDLANAVAFRNLLIHGYATVDQGIVWRTAREDLPRMRRIVRTFLPSWEIFQMDGRGPRPFGHDVADFGATAFLIGRSTGPWAVVLARAPRLTESPPPARVIGIDDFAWHRGHSYGSIGPK